MYYSLNCAFFFYFCYLASVSLTASFAMLVFSSTLFLSRVQKIVLQISMMMPLEQSAEFCLFCGLHLHLQFMFLSCVLSYILQKAFGVVRFCSLSNFLVLSLSFEDVLVEKFLSFSSETAYISQLSTFRSALSSLHESCTLICMHAYVRYSICMTVS